MLKWMNSKCYPWLFLLYSNSFLPSIRWSYVSLVLTPTWRRRRVGSGRRRCCRLGSRRRRRSRRCCWSCSRSLPGAFANWGEPGRRDTSLSLSFSFSLCAYSTSLLSLSVLSLLSLFPEGPFVAPGATDRTFTEGKVVKSETTKLWNLKTIFNHMKLTQCKKKNLH